MPPLAGYDAGGHAGYALTLAREGRWPSPAEGWSTFHPPLYYGLAAGLWQLLEPLGPRAVLAGLRGIGGAAALATGAVAWLLARRLGAGPATAWVAAALVLFVPCHQMAAAMLGNEALAAGLSALALLPLLALQRDPGRLRAALACGAWVGLALAAKFSGAFAATACAVPFLRRGLGPRGRRALWAAAGVAAVLAGPIYLRNWAVAGTPLPMGRDNPLALEQEQRNTLRARRPADYLWLDPEALRRPSIYHVRGDTRSELRRNPAMSNVPGLTLASTWYDAFAHRIPVRYHRDGNPLGPLLVTLGLVPTALALLGFALACAETFRSRGRAEVAPLVALSGVGLVAFVAFTARAPSLLAVKGSYLLPLLPAAAVFFARACEWLRADLRRLLLAVSGAAALAPAIVFTEGLVFESQPAARSARVWLLIGSRLPASNIRPAVEALGARRGAAGRPGGGGP